jgi:hypothetical protein
MINIVKVRKALLANSSRIDEYTALSPDSDALPDQFVT